MARLQDILGHGGPHHPQADKSGSRISRFAHQSSLLSYALSDVSPPYRGPARPWKRDSESLTQSACQEPAYTISTPGQELSSSGPWLEPTGTNRQAPGR